MLAPTVRNVSAPYSWLKNPRHFGFLNNTAGAWKDPRAGEEWALAAAQQQHALSLAVRAWKNANRKGDAVLGKALDVHPETVGRYLRGETALDLPTYNHLAQLAGLQVTIDLD